MASEYEVECPMPGCVESLHLEYDTGYQFGPEDLVGDPTGVALADAHCQSWKVACSAGHVILLPTEYPGCPCGRDSEGPDCRCDIDDYDHAEENRAFRHHDATRLREIVGQLRALS